MGSELMHVEDDGGQVGQLAIEIRNEHTDGWIRVLEPVGTLANALAGTEFVPKALRNKPEAVTAAILFGRELSMPPLQALAQVHMVEGKATLSAEHMRAMVFAAGHEITYPVLKGSQVIARGRRRYADGTWSQPTEVEWNLAMAEYAGLSRKDNWRKYPRAMLEARSTGELCRLVFPDVTHGMLTTEELEDGGDVPEGGAPTSADAPTTKVSRAPRKGTGKAAPAPAIEPPVQSSAAGAPPRPPLPAAKVASRGSAGTSGEGPVSAPEDVQSEPADPDLAARTLDFTDEGDRDLAKHLEMVMFKCPIGPSKHHDPHQFEYDGLSYDCPGLLSHRCDNPEPHTHHRWATTQNFLWCAGDAVDATHTPAPDVQLPEPKQCQALSNGHQCRYAAGHEGKHTYGGGLQDPVGLRHCDLVNEHEPHAWNPRKGEWYSCSGTAVISEGDGSPDDMAATGGPIPDRPDGIGPGQKRALEAAFNSLRVVDRAEVHHICSALLGRKVETLNPIGGSKAGLSSEDGSKLLTALAKVEDREALEALIQRAAEEWGRDA